MQRTKKRRWIAGFVVLFASISLVWFLLLPSRADLERTAIDAIARRDLATAEAALLRMSPRDHDVLRLLADVASGLGRKRESLQWLEKLGDASPHPMEIFCEAGSKAFEFARPIDAERLFRKAVHASPATLEPYRRLARLYVAWQRGDELRKLIAQADAANVSLSDDPSLLWFWIVGDRVDWQEEDSLKWLRSVLEEQPEDPFATAATIRAASNSGALSLDGRATPPTSIKSSKSWPLVLAQATFEFTSNRIDDSLATVSRMPSDGESHAETWFLRGRIAEEVGDSTTALSAFEYSSHLDPFFVAPLYHRGHLMAKVGKTVESETLLRHAVHVDELVRRCIAFLQSTHPNSEDLASAAVLAVDLGQERWAQHVCKLAERVDKRVKLSEPLISMRQKTLSALAVPKPGSLPPTTRIKPHSTHSDHTPDKRASHSDPSPVRFSDATLELGLNFVYEYGHTRERWLMETLGGGVAVLDFDRDGWPDLFFSQGGTLTTQDKTHARSGLLCRNLRGAALLNVTVVANTSVQKYSHGDAVGDVNSDGFADLLVCHYEGLSLLINQGDGTFRESTTMVTDPASSDGRLNPQETDPRNRWNSSAALADFNLDGHLDIYIAGYCHAPMSSELRTCRDEGQFSPCRPSAYPAEPDTLLMNTGSGQLEDCSIAYGIHEISGYGLGVIVADFDQDGSSEIFVGNDTTQNFFWHRPKPSEELGQKFLDIGLVAGVAVDGSGRAEACMGIACGDVDGDQRLDLFVTNFFDETCTFYQNQGSLQFEDRTQQFGLSNAGRRLMGWGCQLFDADNDGWLDLVILNGYLHDTPQLPQFYRNRSGRFGESSSTSGLYFQQPKLGRSIATWDYNRDGRIDFVASHQTEPASVLRNDSSVGHHLTLTLVGTKSVRDATGTLILAKIGNERILRLVSSQGGYLSACSADVNIGLGSADFVDELEIAWPSGVRERFGKLQSGQHLVIREEGGEPVPLSVETE